MNVPVMPWVQAPAAGLPDTLKSMTWKKRGNFSAAQDSAALMIYIALLFVRDVRRTARAEFGIELTTVENVAETSYDELSHRTGLSRSLISQGIARLEELGLVKPTGSNQKRRYVISWPAGRWFKLPCRAIYSGEGVPAFKTFTMRTKHELNALKLFLYLASVRDSATKYAEAKYETINERIGVPERDIRRAINVLTAAGLLAQLNPEPDTTNPGWQANKYYLAGYRDLVWNKKESAAAQTPA